ncbi:Txe/YoeB family addiction module toxin [Staphylococcus epidermidis]|uniref:Txe/YoeB family addiction module toxin n=2 Tax=Staphylococcus TaxID=1279 RepID=UPI001CEF9953|nr:Txe/YoeB family addiction module toxin [Staphylococcus epidermidis]MCO6226077.1 Txe/YoeB family addiction module toxin [Staphylococcus epidermidis]MCO6231146.1 Txe/YoeB family addiction module toxin [Staphylococcus epidermidis]
MLKLYYKFNFATEPIIKYDPYQQSQSFEKLHPKHLGRYSRRINHQHRVVYTIDEENKEVLILAAWSHYE